MRKKKAKCLYICSTSFFFALTDIFLVCKLNKPTFLINNEWMSQLAKGFTLLFIIIIIYLFIYLFANGFLCPLSLSPRLVRDLISLCFPTIMDKE